MTMLKNDASKVQRYKIRTYSRKLFSGRHSYRFVVNFFQDGTRNLERNLLYINNI